MASNVKSRIPTSRVPGLPWPATSGVSRRSACRCSAKPRSRTSARSSEVERKRILTQFFSFPIPCVFITKGLEAVTPLVDLASAARRAAPPLAAQDGRVLSPASSRCWRSCSRRAARLHGSLADVFGVGVLFTGESGIGKSECVLDLVERGHRLVADDLVICFRRGNDVLIGRGHELQRHFMEIRGVGLIDMPLDLRHSRRAPAEAHRGRRAARGVGRGRRRSTAPASTPR